MNPVVRAQLKEFQSSNPTEKLSESEVFEVMSIFAVENGLLGENLDPFKAHLRGQEFGLDGVAILVQGSLCVDADEAQDILSAGKNHSAEFHFFQSKTSENIDYGDVSKFLDAVYDFFGEATLVKGDQISDLLQVKDLIYGAASKENPKLKCFYCTTGTGEIAAPIQKLVESSKARLEALSIFSSIDIQLLGAKSVQAGYRTATNSISATIEFPRNVTLPEHNLVDEG